MIPALINIIVYLLILGLVYWVVILIIDGVPVPNPPARIIKLAVLVIIVLAVILLLLDLIGVQTGMDLPRVTTQ